MSKETSDAIRDLALLLTLFSCVAMLTLTWRTHIELNCVKAGFAAKISDMDVVRRVCK